MEDCLHIFPLLFPYFTTPPPPTYLVEFPDGHFVQDFIQHAQDLSERESARARERERGEEEEGRARAPARARARETDVCMSINVNNISLHSYKPLRQ